MPVLTVPGMVKYRPAAKRREIRDSLAPGLHLVIQPKRTDDRREPARCSWAMRFRRPDGRTAKLTLGPVDFSEGENAEEPVLGAPLTLRAARQLANKVDRDRARGVDVVEEYKADRERKRASASEAAENTFPKLATEFIRDHRVRRWGTWPRRWRETAALLGLRWDRSSADPTKAEPEIIPGGQADKWRDKPVSTIDDHAVHTCIAETRKKGIPGLKKRNKGASDSRARKMHGALSAFFKWAKHQRKIAANPCLDVWRPEPRPARKRAFTDAEIKVFWTATEQIAEPFRSALRVLLLTGQRLREVAGMVDHELGSFLPGAPTDLWTLGPDRTKNHREHHVPLAQLVKEMINDVPRVEAPRGQNFSYVFSTTGSTPISGWSKMKKRLNKAMGKDVQHWTLHDLRRSCATGMQRLGVRPEVIERALNHVSGTFGGIVGTYQTDLLATEVKNALERWSQHVAGLVAGGDNVVPLRAETKK